MMQLEQHVAFSTLVGNLLDWFADLLCDHVLLLPVGDNFVHSQGTYKYDTVRRFGRTIR